MKKISLRTKAVFIFAIVLLVFVGFSIGISYIFYSDAVKMSGVPDAVSSKTQFFIIYTCAEVLFALILILLVVYLVSVFVVDPLIGLRKAVECVVPAEGTDAEGAICLKDLNIKSRDEIEELYKSLQKMQIDMNEYLLGMQSTSWDCEHDNMTMLSNSAKFEKRKLSVYPYLDSVFMACIDVINLRMVNDKLGTEAGDSIISKVAREMRRLHSDDVHTYRLEEDNFLIVMCNVAEEEASLTVDRWVERVGRLNRASDAFECKLVWGGSYGEGDFIVDDVYKRADAEMYCRKMVVKNELGN